MAKRDRKGVLNPLPPTPLFFGYSPFVRFWIINPSLKNVTDYKSVTRGII